MNGGLRKDQRDQRDQKDQIILREDPLLLGGYEFC